MYTSEKSRNVAAASSYTIPQLLLLQRIWIFQFHEKFSQPRNRRSQPPRGRPYLTYLHPPTYPPIPSGCTRVVFRPGREIATGKCERLLDATYRLNACIPKPPSHSLSLPPCPADAVRHKTAFTVKSISYKTFKIHYIPLTHYCKTFFFTLFLSFLICTLYFHRATVWKYFTLYRFLQDTKVLLSQTELFYTPKCCPNIFLWYFNY